MYPDGKIEGTIDRSDIATNDITAAFLDADRHIGRWNKLLQDIIPDGEWVVEALKDHANWESWRGHGPVANYVAITGEGEGRTTAVVQYWDQA